MPGGRAWPFECSARWSEAACHMPCWRSCRVRAPAPRWEQPPDTCDLRQRSLFGSWFPRAQSVVSQLQKWHGGRVWWRTTAQAVAARGRSRGQADSLVGHTPVSASCLQPNPHISLLDECCDQQGAPRPRHLPSVPPLNTGTCGDVLDSGSIDSTACGDLWACLWAAFPALELWQLIVHQGRWRQRSCRPDRPFLTATLSVSISVSRVSLALGRQSSRLLEMAFWSKRDVRGGANFFLLQGTPSLQQEVQGAQSDDGS